MPPHEIDELLDYLNSHLPGQQAQSGIVNYKYVRLVCVRPFVKSETLFLTYTP